MSGSNKKRMMFSLVIFILVWAGGFPAGLPVAAAPVNPVSVPAPIDEEKIYYGIEVNGVLCGYAEFDVSPMEKDGRELILLNENMFAMLTALGMAFNTEVKLTYHIDPSTGQFTYHSSDVKQGDVRLDSAVYVEGDTIRFTSTLSGEEKRIAIGPDVLLENTLIFPHLVHDFVDSGLDEKTYDIFEVRDAEVQKTAYTKVGTEELRLAGKKYSALVLDEMNLATGLKIKWWIDIETGHLLKVIPIGNRVIYLAKPSVVKKIKTADLDDLILSKTNVTIADISAISYMKVRGIIEPVGLKVTPEGLNVPGQSFTGTVKDNLIEGVFEIEHPRYDGAGAPVFPPDFNGDESLEEFLEASEFIESNDPVLVEQARTITEGANDSWEAAVRLSEWVAENINYAIPGGGTARKTYDLRAGECGAHSLLLTALCRAVGIPARVVWGCMYTPNAGGSFGQHGWNEIYMGEAGWIPVDATAAETDYADSGHIRIGVMRSSVISFNPHEMEILDHRVGTGEVDEAALEEYERYVGEYESVEHPEGSGLKLIVQDNALALNIPGRMVLALKDPDEKGRWYCTASSRMFLTFSENDAGEIEIMRVHEIITMTRKSDEVKAGEDPVDETGESETGAGEAGDTTPVEITESVPDEFRPYIGTYYFAAFQANFTMSYRDGGLALYDPIEKATIRLQPPDEDGWRMDEFNKNRMRFEIDDDGNVTGLKIDAVTTMRKR